MSANHLQQLVFRPSFCSRDVQEQRKLQKTELYHFVVFCEIVKIKRVEMGRTCSIREAYKNAFLILLVNPFSLESKIFSMWTVRI
jgi:hypothetical protein